MLQPEIVQSTADFHHGIADMIGPPAKVVFQNRTALDRVDAVLNPYPTFGNRAIRRFLVIGQPHSFQFGGRAIAQQMFAMKKHSCWHILLLNGKEHAKLNNNLCGSSS